MQKWTFLLGWGLSLLVNFQKKRGALTGPQFVEGVVAKDGGVTFFRGFGCKFSTKNN